MSRRRDPRDPRAVRVTYVGFRQLVLAGVMLLLLQQASPVTAVTVYRDLSPVSGDDYLLSDSSTFDRAELDVFPPAVAGVLVNASSGAVTGVLYRMRANSSKIGRLQASPGTDFHEPDPVFADAPAGTFVQFARSFTPMALPERHSCLADAPVDDDDDGSKARALCAAYPRCLGFSLPAGCLLSSDTPIEAGSAVQGMTLMHKEDNFAAVIWLGDNVALSTTLLLGVYLASAFGSSRLLRG